MYLDLHKESNDSQSIIGCGKYYGMGYPPYHVRTDTQSENITLPHPSDAGGKYHNVPEK